MFEKSIQTSKTVADQNAICSGCRLATPNLAIYVSMTFVTFLDNKRHDPKSKTIPAFDLYAE